MPRRINIHRRLARRIKQGDAIFKDIFELEERFVVNAILGQTIELGQSPLSEKRIKQLIVENVLLDESQWSKLTEKLVNPWVMGTVADGGQVALSSLNPGTIFNVVDPFVVETMGQRVIGFSRFTVETTNLQIKRILEKAIEEGISIQEMGEKIHEYFAQDCSIGRAARIARTETVGAHNCGNMVGMKQSGVVDNHMWLTAGDADVRESHQIDGSVRKIGSDFPLGMDYTGYSRQFPSDMNERCTTIPTRQAVN